MGVYLAEIKIPITKPFFGEEEKRAISETLESGWVVQGPKVAEFERLFAEFTGVKYAVATTSCTTALHLSLLALGVGSEDEVILPSFTFVATANAVEYTGAKPIFCDIDLHTFNIDVEKIPGKITPRTKAIIPVHLFGLSADMEPIMEIAERYGLRVIEDAACGLGSLYHARHVGTIGDTGCFSFHPRKSVTTGEGGMITTQREDVNRLARSLRDHGASHSDLARHAEKSDFLLAEYNHLGYNYRMTDLQGALGCAQMGRVEWILAERRRRARLYDEMLSDVEWLKKPMVPDGCAHSYQTYVCLFCPEAPTLDNVVRLHLRRKDLMERLEGKGIATRQGTHAVHALGNFRKKYKLDPWDLPKAWMADQLCLTLPLYPQMTEEEQNTVIRALEVLRP